MILPFALALVTCVAALLAAAAVAGRRDAARARGRERRLLAVIDGAAAGLLLIDARGGVVLANPAAERILGRSRRDLGVLRLEELAPAGDATLRSGDRAVELAIAPLAGGDRVASLVDVTERVRAAGVAAREKDEFLATVSHELRTPMNAILGLSAEVLGGSLSLDARRLLERLHGSAAGLMALLNDTLDFARIEAGTLSIEQLELSPRAVTQEVVDLLMSSATGKQLELVLDVAPDVPARLVGDPGRIRQVLLHLAANAVKFTERGEVVVRLAVLSAAADGVLLRWTVIDTGVGVPPELHSRLFQPFRQADGRAARRHGGAGIGLAICRRLCDLMGGAIAVDSGSRSGSTFHFTLALRRPVPGSTAASPPRFARGRVLVAERNPTQRAALVAQLRAWGLDTEDTGDAADALLRLAAAPGFDAALLDARLPGLEAPPHGAAALIELGAGQVARPRPPFAAALPRPFHGSALYEALAAALDAGREPSPAPPPAAPLAGVRVLLAEDNAVNQLVAVRMLQRFGCRVDVCANGIEAVDAALSHGYDVVLMDCQMPEMDGYEATRVLRRRLAGAAAPTAPDVPIVALTANAMRGDRERCLDAGMDDYLAKPVTVQSLEGVLRRWALSASAR